MRDKLEYNMYSIYLGTNRHLQGVRLQGCIVYRNKHEAPVQSLTHIITTFTGKTA